MEIAQTYLGNLTEDSNLATKVTQARQQGFCLEVFLNQSDRSKGRIQAHSTSGEAIGIIKSRDWSMREADVFRTQSDRLVVIQLQEQELLVLSFEQPMTASATELVHLGHVLGNHHYPISITNQKIYLQPGADLKIVEQTIKQLQIAGLIINYEWQSLDSLNFTHQSHYHH
jgi:urease accessory protein